MDRKEFINKSFKIGTSCAIIPLLSGAVTVKEDEDLTDCIYEKEFIQNWLSDLLDTIDSELNIETRIRLMEGCGRGCFNRFSFKKDIALKGKDDLDKLVQAYSDNFEIWKDNNDIHIRYGETSPGCYCPAARFREPKKNDLHCECTRTTHQTIFETALNKKVRVEILESVRRGGKTCHFLVHI